MPPDSALQLTGSPETHRPTPRAVEEARAIWRSHRRWVAAILLAHKPRDVELDDLLQTVALQVVRHAGEIRGGEASVKPWLRTVAINAARAAGRSSSARRRNLKLVGLEDDAPIAGEAEPSAASLERGRELLRLAERLPEHYREPLLLRCVKGMSYRQIAEVTGLPETTIETRITRGRRMLRELSEKADRPIATVDPAAAPSERSPT